MLEVFFPLTVFKIPMIQGYGQIYFFSPGFLLKLFLQPLLLRV